MKCDNVTKIDRPISKGVKQILNNVFYNIKNCFWLYRNDPGFCKLQICSGMKSLMR